MTDNDVLRDLRSEIVDAEVELFRGALYLVHDADEAAALADLGLDATLATATMDVLDGARNAAERGRPVVVVHATDGALRHHLRTHVPTATLYDYALPSGVASLCGLLGWARGTKWDADTCEARAYVLCSEMTERARLAVPGDADAAGSFPVSSLPPVVRAMVVEGARAQGVDAALWAVPALPILAGCIGATRRVRISRDWREPIIAWAATVAVSGSGKSPAMRTLLAPVRDHDLILHRRNIEAQQRHAAEIDTWKSAPAAERGPKPATPPTLAAVIDDATAEAVATRLNDNRRGLTLAADELAGWTAGFDRYRQGAGDVQRWLSIYSAADLVVDRKGTGRIYVPRPCVSVVGSIQPSVARKHLAGDEQRASGLLARLLLAAPPLTAARLTDREIPQHVVDDYARVIRGLLDLDFGKDGEPVDLGLSRAAFGRFRQWHDALADDGFASAKAGDEDRCAMLSKLRGYAPRLAGAIALARAAETGTAALLREISDEDVATGIALCDYFANEAARLYGQWSESAASDRVDRERGSLHSLARRLDNILRTGGPKAADELYDATGRNVSADRLRAALRLAGATCEVVQGPRGGRPREQWSAGPAGALQ